MTRLEGPRRYGPIQTSGLDAPVLRALADQTFRANSVYEIVRYSQLDRAERELLGPLRREALGGAILRASEASAYTLKVAGADTVALVASLRRARRLPNRVRDTYSDQTNVEIARLVLDGVLEMRAGRTFVTAAEAHDHVFEAVPAQAPADRIAQLSEDALRHAYTLDLTDVLELSARLYFYSRAPITPFWKQRLAGRAAVDAMLSLGPGGSIRPLLARHWRQSRASPGWIIWTRRTRNASLRRDLTTYKLYVSPTYDALREVFPAIVRVLARSDAAAFKVGSDLSGLLRPDKLVAYFADRRTMLHVAEALRAELRDVPSHGVPFTGTLAPSGVLSWGLDPPSDYALPDWRERESWRLWVTNRLALYLLTAKRSRCASPPAWDFALHRLWLDGVDVKTWTPTQWRA